MLRLPVFRLPANLLLALLCLPVALMTGGCANETVAIGESVKMLVARSDPAEGVPLRPGYRYLRVTVDGRKVLLVLGYVDPNPHGEIEVWYSAEREVIKLQRGHIVGTAGLAIDWRDVRFVSAPPDARRLREHAVQYTRERDEMPGYRYGIRETIVARSIAVPQSSAIKAIDPASLHWIEETVKTSRPGAEPLPPARFAIETQGGVETVVYSEQCLAPSLCLALQRWPAVVSRVQ